jgi:peroxiredoxin
VLMITSTDQRQSQIVLRDLGLKMPLLSDPSCRVFRKYRVGQALGAPLSAQFVCDRAGRIRFRHLFSFLEPNASSDRLLAALDQL